MDIPIELYIYIWSENFSHSAYDKRDSVQSDPMRKETLAQERSEAKTAEWTIPQLTKILNSTSLDKNFITA
jgi:hypothetical protein